MSSIEYINAVIRSRPKPNAKPEYTVGSTPQARRTFGWTMPLPPSSIHPEPLHGRQRSLSNLPVPWHLKHEKSNSADGSVKGKYDGRKRVCVSSPKRRFSHSVTVPLRWAIVIPLSTHRPSSWWNIG